MYIPNGQLGGTVDREKLEVAHFSKQPTFGGFTNTEWVIFNLPLLCALWWLTDILMNWWICLLARLFTDLCLSSLIIKCCNMETGNKVERAFVQQRSDTHWPHTAALIRSALHRCTKNTWTLYSYSSGHSAAAESRSVGWCGGVRVIIPVVPGFPAVKMQ